MKFFPTPLEGAYLLEIEPIADERGFFARSYCQDEFAQLGLNTNLVQCSISSNRSKGTLRGMHYQAEPYPETKIVRCVRGSIFDVIIDIRKNSPTLNRWFGVELNNENKKALYIPEGFAHGFLTLEDNTEVFYQMSEFFHPECAKGVRWDDPAFNVNWPEEIVVISQKDADYPYINQHNL